MYTFNNLTKGFFSKEDEALIKILCDFSKIVLKHAINNDEQVLSYNKLRLTIKVNILISKLESGLTIGGAYNMGRREFLITAENILKGLMNTD